MIMDRNIKILNNLFMMARDVEGMGSSRLAAALFYKNRAISYGINQNKTHPFQATYGKNEEAIYWHAETNAIFNGLKITEVEGTTLYVARAKHPEGETERWIWGNSKPCNGCMSCAYKYGISRIIYTQDEIGHYGVINVEI